jgi:hypothetical protein
MYVRKQEKGQRTERLNEQMRKEREMKCGFWYWIKHGTYSACLRTSRRDGWSFIFRILCPTCKVANTTQQLANRLLCTKQALVFIITRNVETRDERQPRPYWLTAFRPWMYLLCWLQYEIRLLGKKQLYSEQQPTLHIIIMLSCCKNFS